MSRLIGELLRQRVGKLSSKAFGESLASIHLHIGRGADLGRGSGVTGVPAFRTSALLVARGRTR